MDDLKNATDEFSLNLYGQVASDPQNTNKNIFLSPLSVQSALLLTYLGANGETKSEIESTLQLHNFSGKEEALLNQYSDVLSVFVPSKDDKGNNNFELALANKAYRQTGKPLKQGYEESIQKSLKSEVSEVDFAGDTAGAVKTINQWVEGKTNQKIKNILTTDVVDPITVYILVNAIYFKADWMSKFKEENTKQDNFYNLDGSTKQISLMFQKMKAHLFDSDSKYFAKSDIKLPPFQILQLPYKGKEMSMLIILPKDKKGLHELEKVLTVESLNKAQEKACNCAVLVYLPRFKLEAEYQLKPILQKLGIEKAFGGADFSRMTDDPSVYVSEVIHKAFIEVNEEGTEAAAATAVVMKLKGSPPPPLEFRADHPFIFAIRHEETGLIAFMGRVANL